MVLNGFFHIMVMSDKTAIFQLKVSRIMTIFFLNLLGDYCNPSIGSPALPLILAPPQLSNGNYPPVTSCTNLWAARLLDCGETVQFARASPGSDVIPWGGDGDCPFTHCRDFHYTANNIQSCFSVESFPALNGCRKKILLWPRL